MKYFLILFFMTGCAAGSSWNASMLDGGNSNAEQKMVLDKNIQAMSRNEVILAVQEC